MSYTIERIQEEIERACEKAEVPLIVPIVINGRLRRVLGRVSYVYDHYDEVVPTKIEFSKFFLDTTSDEDIRSVILHETVHYIVAMRTGEKHGHDKEFKATCKEIGTRFDKCAVEGLHYTVPEEKMYKYVIYCPNCKKIVGWKHRRCKVIDKIEYYACNECKQHDLEVIQNW